jgi:putative Mg2+ transporter-C (MgtC) family protein
VIVLIVLAGIKPLEERFRRRNQARSLTLLTRHGEFSLDVLKQTAGPLSNRVQQFVMQQAGPRRSTRSRSPLPASPKPSSRISFES